MRLGTSSLVVAAFVGPGTVLTCAAAGVDFGYALGWVLLFATTATFVLQSFTANTGILARQGLGEALRHTLQARWARATAFGLVVLGLWVGTAAFETGNLIGAAAGVTALLEDRIPRRAVLLLVAAAAAAILLLDLRRIAQLFTALVIAMSGLFVAGMLLAPVDWAAAARGLVTPAVPEGGLVTVVALLGTTIVTYNLFLHPSAAKAYWADTPDRTAAWRGELRGMALFLPIGGLVSFAILAAGATLAGQEGAAGDVAAFAVLLEPVAGPGARYCFGLGLLAAGITSAMTAPLAAAAGIREIFGWPDDTTDTRYRLVWASVLGTGLVFALGDWSPLAAIIAAQAANGLLLPLIAGFMLYLSLRQEVVYLPRWYYGVGLLVVLICGGLGGRTLWWVWGQVAG